MVVAGTEAAVLMVESEAQELTEDQMLGGVLFGHDSMQIAIKAIKDLAAEAGKPRWEVLGAAAERGVGHGGRRSGQSRSRCGLSHDRQAGASGEGRWTA